MFIFYFKKLHFKPMSFNTGRPVMLFAENAVNVKRDVVILVNMSS